MERVLVMGGSYFIGRHVVNTLKHDYALHVLNRGSRPLNDPEVRELRSDRNEPTAMKKVLDGKTFEHVIDLSCFTETQARILIKSLDMDSIKSFVFISTSAVYDIHKATPPFKEGDPVGGESPFKQYAKDKIEAENYLKSVMDPSKLVIYRPPYIYGENNYVPRERLFFYLIEEELPIYVPRSNNRIQFNYAGDLAKDIESAVKGEVPGGTYNVGDPDAVTFTEFIHRTAKQVGKEPWIQFVDSSRLDIPLMHYFPFFDYDNILSVDKLHAQVSHVTVMDKVLERAYRDYRSIKPSSLSERMVRAREKLARMIH
ncbi:MAG: NAD-dependent epimerase/dehydratase family protein [Bacillota bacterium]